MKRIAELVVAALVWGSVLAAAPAQPPPQPPPPQPQPQPPQSPPLEGAQKERADRLLDNLNAAVDEMDRVTQSNAAMVEESAAASHSLSDEATGLAQKVGRFRIADEPMRRSA